MLSLRRKRPVQDLAGTAATADAQAASPVAPSGDALMPKAPEPDRELMSLLARLSAAASDAGTSIGWMTHDASGTAEQARLIAAASEELAASTSEIAARSSSAAETAETADTAQKQTRKSEDGDVNGLLLTRP